MARLFGKLLKILKLDAPIAFTERVNIVHVAHDWRGRLGEGAGAQASQKLSLPQPPVNIGHAGLDVLAKLELVAALGDLPAPKIPGPIIHILK